MPKPHHFGPFCGTINRGLCPKTRVLGTTNRIYNRGLCQNPTILAPKFRRYNRGLCPKPVFWAPQIADITEDCAKTPPFWPLLRHHKSQILPRIGLTPSVRKIFPDGSEPLFRLHPVPFYLFRDRAPLSERPEGFFACGISNPISFTLLPGRPVLCFDP